MSAIPRTKISLHYNEIFGFIARLLLFCSKEKENKIISAFESEFASGYNLPRGVIFNKARMAFYFLLKNMDIKPGGEVIISALHIADFVNIIRCAGFKPIVVDVDEETYAVDYGDLENKINEETVLFLVTHLSGFATDMDRIKDISKKTGVPFMEDCSQAYSAYYKDRRLGTFGRAAIFSQGLLKTICTFSGGMVIANDEQLLRKLQEEKNNLDKPLKFPLLAEAVKNLVVKVATGELVFNCVVFPLLRFAAKPMDFFSRYQKANKTVCLREKLPENFFVRFSWQQALLGLEQLKTVKDREDKKIKSAKYLYHSIENDHYVKKVKSLGNCSHAFWSFPVRVKSTRRFIKFLAARGIDSTCTLMSVLSDEVEFSVLNFNAPKASKIKEHTLLIPLYPHLTEKECAYMSTVINNYKD